MLKRATRNLVESTKNHAFGSKKGHAAMPMVGRLTQLYFTLKGNPERLVFAFLVIAYLVPIWAFTFLPTQDGPCHLNNAQIIKNCAYWKECSAIFELRVEPLPNLTSHVLLAAFYYVMPPLVAEKVLLSLYVVGFAAGYRYFLLAFGPRCAAMSWTALLMVYSRCFWMGFYNYCVGMALIWITLGYLLRRRGEFSWHVVTTLSLLFTLAYFTHLSVFLLAMLGAACIGLLAPTRRLLGVGAVITAAIPALCLTAYYFGATGFTNAPSALQIVEEPLARLRGEDTRTTVVNDLLNIDGELFAYHVGEETPGTLVLVGLLVLQTAFCVVESRLMKPVEPEAIGRTFPLVFAVLVIVLYFLLPDDLGEHGGFIKTRLAPLILLFWLPSLRESTQLEVRWFFRGLTFLLAVLNLGLVIATVEAGNRALEEYNAGIAAVGTGKRLFVVQTDPRVVPLVNPLLHAADYYCLGTKNVNLDNYEAAALHFPVKYRAGMIRGRNYFKAYPDRDVVDVVLCWQLRGTAPPRGAEDWIEIFRGESMRIYARP